MTATVIRSNGYDVAITGARHQALEWIETHLPTGRDNSVATGTMTLNVICSSDRWSELDYSLPRVSAQALYYQNLQYNVQVAGESRFFVSRGQFGNPDHAVIVSNAHEYQVILAAEDSLTDRLILRIVRMMTRGGLLASGGVLVHSSAVVTQAGGVLLVAKSGGGKTSSSVAAAMRLDGELVSTDRTVVSRRVDGAITAHGGPEMHRLGLGFVRSLGMPEEVTDRLVRRDVAPAITDEALRFGGRSKFEFTFKDLNALGVRSTDGGRITAVVHIGVGRTTRVTRMTPEQKSLVLSELLHPDPGLRFPWAVGIKDASEAAGEMERVLEVLDQYSVEWNPGEADSLSRSMEELARRARLT